MNIHESINYFKSYYHPIIGIFKGDYFTKDNFPSYDILYDEIMKVLIEYDYRENETLDTFGGEEVRDRLMIKNGDIPIGH
jgi:hypothetical protein